MSDQINSTSFDEVDVIMMANEDCNELVDKEPEDIMIDSDTEVDMCEKPDEDVADITYDEQRDDATTIEDMAAEDFRAARDIGIETGFVDVDDEIEDILYGDIDEVEDGEIEDDEPDSVKESEFLNGITIL